MVRHDTRGAAAFLVLLAGIIGCITVPGEYAVADPGERDSSTDVHAAASVADLCKRAFAAFTHDAINFEESTTTLRSSAYPVLDKIISLADACRNSTVVITGHSDSSGDEGSNLKLSRDRALAVADHLAQRGIARDRLSVAGVGSAEPVADNGTRYGRSLNRRIQIVLRYNG